MKKANGSASFRRPAILFSQAAYDQFVVEQTRSAQEHLDVPAGRRPIFAGAEHFRVPDGMIDEFEVGEYDEIIERHKELVGRTSIPPFPRSGEKPRCSA